MEAYDLYSGTYVALPAPKALAPKAVSVAVMQEHDRLLAEKGYDAVAAVVEGTGVAPSATMDAYHMLRDPSRETALEMRERFLSVNPAIEAWAKIMHEEMDRRLAELAVYGSSPIFFGFDEASELPREIKFSHAPSIFKWHFPEPPLTLRERERAHIKTLNGGDQPWKRKR